MLIKSTRLTGVQLILLTLTIYLAFYYGLGAYPLANNNEGLYAEVAREMLVRHDYIIPHLNFVPYIEKPPLLYWLIAASYHAFGVTAFAARFVTATSGALTCVALCWLGFKSERAQQGWLAALIFASSVGVIIIARVVFFDMLLTCCLTWTLSCFYIWWRTPRRHYLFGAYTALAAAMLCKGLLALVLVGAISFSFILLNRQARRLGALLHPTCLAWFLLLIVPWHLMASLQQPGFAWDYFINEQLLRFVNQRLPHDYYHGPIYYYLPRIVLYLWPWSLLLPLCLPRRSREPASASTLTSLSIVWFAIPLLFFSISGAKANYYMIVGMPALALLLANGLQTVLAAGKNKSFIAASSVLCFLLSAALLTIHLRYSLSETQIWSQYKFALWGLLGLNLIALLGQIKTRCELNQTNLEHLRKDASLKKSGHYLWLSMCSFSWLLVYPAPLLLQTQSAAYSEWRLAHYMKNQLVPRPIYFYKNYAKQSSLLFYLQQRIPLVDSHDADLAYGARTAAASGWFLSASQFAMIAAREQVYVVVNKDYLTDFNRLSHGINFKTLAQSEQAVLLENKPR